MGNQADGSTDEEVVLATHDVYDDALNVHVAYLEITMNVVPVGPKSATVTCPSCRAVISTRTESKSTTKTHIIAIVLFLFLCWPCICVPYCMDSCKNIDHYCPSCNSYLGTYKS